MYLPYRELFSCLESAAMRELRKLSKAKMLEIFAAEYIKSYGYGGVANEQSLKPL